MPAEWHYSAPVLGVHPWKLTDLYYRPDVEVVGDLGQALAELQRNFRARWQADSGRVAKERAQTSILVEAPGLSPHEVVLAVRKAAPPGVITTVDAGAHMLVVMPLWPVEEPNRLLISNGLATMGFACIRRSRRHWLVATNRCSASSATGVSA